MDLALLKSEKNAVISAYSSLNNKSLVYKALLKHWLFKGGVSQEPEY